MGFVQVDNANNINDIPPHEPPLQATTLDKLCCKMPKTCNRNRKAHRISVKIPIPPFNVERW